MKRTDLMRRERELKRAMKKEAKLEKNEDDSDMSVGGYIKRLTALFFHDEEKIYNIQQSDEILELLDSMQKNVEERHWESIIRKAVKATGVKKREVHVKELIELLG